MSRFIYKLIGFISIFCIGLFLAVFLNKFFSNIKIDKSQNTLVLGHSHSECAFNDSLISGLVNYSQSGESYFYTYYKIKLLIDKNPHINKVLIGFSNNQADNLMDEWIWGDKYILHNLPKYGQFLDLEGLSLLLDNNPKGFKQSMVPSFKNNFKMLFKGLKYKNEIGGYLYLVKEKADSIIANLSIKKEPVHDTYKSSQYNIKYLHKIITYCEQKKIKVFLIRSPLHKMYTGFQNEPSFQKLLKNQFSTVEFLDFSKFPLSNMEFGDLEHLNYKGAKIFSIWFAGLLNNGLLDSTNKQSFIDREINVRTHNSELPTSRVFHQGGQVMLR